MKIQISEYETYTIDFPDEISAKEFLSLVDKLRRVFKNFISDDFSDLNIKNNTEIKEKVKYYPNYKKHNYLFHKDRNEALKVAKLHYFGTTQEKEDYAKKYNVTWDSISSLIMYKVVPKFNIKPEELGLIRFRRKGESLISIDALRIKKSNDTGENGNTN